MRVNKQDKYIRAHVMLTAVMRDIAALTTNEGTELESLLAEIQGLAGNALKAAKVLSLAEEMELATGRLHASTLQYIRIVLEDPANSAADCYDLISATLAEIGLPVREG